MLPLSKNSVALLHKFLGKLRSSELVRNISKVYAGDVISKFVGLFTTVLLIRGLPVSDYAQYFAFMTVAFLFPALIGGGINIALIRYTAEHLSLTNKRPFNLYLLSLLIQLSIYSLLYIIVFFFRNQICQLLFGTQPYLMALTLGLTTGLFKIVAGVAESIYQAEEKFGNYIRILWTRQIGHAVIISLLFFAANLTFQTAATALLGVEFFVAGVTTASIYLTFHKNKAPGFQIRHSSIAAAFLSSMKWLVVYHLLLTAFGYLDVFMLSNLSTEHQLAIYGVAGRYYGMALLLLTSIHRVLLPKFSKVHMKSRNLQRSFARKWLKLSIGLILPILFLDLTCKPLFTLINGIQYEAAYAVLVILSIGVWISLTMSPIGSILKARSEFRFIAGLGLAALLFNFIGNYLLIPHWGAAAAAMVTVTSHALINITATAKVFSSNHN